MTVPLRSRMRPRGASTATVRVRFWVACTSSCGASMTWRYQRRAKSATKHPMTTTPITLMRRRGDAVSTGQASAGWETVGRGAHDPTSPADERRHRSAGRRWSASLSAQRHARANGQHQHGRRHRHHGHDHEEVAAEHLRLAQQGAEQGEQADPEHRAQRGDGHVSQRAERTIAVSRAPARAPAAR